MENGPFIHFCMSGPAVYMAFDSSQNTGVGGKLMKKLSSEDREKLVSLGELSMNFWKRSGKTLSP